jgi:probable phosphoglycerate mutase
MKLIFVRHGEPLKEDYGISEMGISEMELLASYLRDNFLVDKIYCADSQRASESAAVLNKSLNMEIEYHSWLSEFKYRIPALTEKGIFPWEFAPEYWINNDEMLDHNGVFKTPLIKNSEVVSKTEEVWKGIDQIISQNGYERDGNLYVVKEANKKEIVIVTHFATMAVIMAHLMNVSILVTLNMLFMAPSSYTVFSTEEINSGKAIFRCMELGSTKHLYGHDELKSEYGRQDEVKNLEN